MDKTYRISVFGKAGCQKCKILNQRIDKLLTKPEWADFEKAYVDVETEDGLVLFCNAECINPQRIPAFLIEKWDDEQGRHLPVVNIRAGEPDSVCKASKLYTYLGLQTDYSTSGTITPRMLTSVMKEAKSA